MFYDWNKINAKRGQMGLFDREDGCDDIAIKSTGNIKEIGCSS